MTSTRMLFSSSVLSTGAVARWCAAALVLGAAMSPSWGQQEQTTQESNNSPIVYERVVSTGAPSAEASNTVKGANLLPEGEPEAARSPVRSYQEDAGSRIEELRVRGQTQEITVKPAGNMPAYEVEPSNSRNNPVHRGRSSEGTNGPRRWKLGEF